MHTWGIYSLADGKVAGSGYKYEIQEGTFENEKLIMEDNAAHYNTGTTYNI